MTDDNNPYHRIGGADVLRDLVDRFYDLMHTLPEAIVIRRMHPDDLQSSRDKLFQFMSGFLGGPPLYVERYGHPRLRQRHLPFAVDSAARDQWMLCMNRALDDTVTDKLLRMQLSTKLAQVGDHMRNQPD